MALERHDLADPIDVHVGGAIRAARLQRGITQTGMAEAIGVSFQQVQKYENGSNRISASALSRIAAALGCKIGEFFPEEDNASSAETATSQPDTGIVGLDEMTVLFSRLGLSRRAILLDVARQFSNLELRDNPARD